MTRIMNHILPLPADEAEAFMLVMLNVLTDAHARLNELEDPHVLPVELIGYHHLVQVSYQSYETLIRHMGYGQHASHKENIRRYNGYMAALPP
jgi:hypothetical protein